MVSYHSSQDAVNATEYPASTRSESTSEEVQGNLSHGPVETENPYKSDDDVDVQGNLSHDLPDWLQEFQENLVDVSVPERFLFFSWITFRAASNSGIGYAQYFCSLPEGPKLRYLLENQDYIGFLQKTH